MKLWLPPQAGGWCGRPDACRGALVPRDHGSAECHTAEGLCVHWWVFREAGSARPLTSVSSVTALGFMALCFGGYFFELELQGERKDLMHVIAFHPCSNQGDPITPSRGWETHWDIEQLWNSVLGPGAPRGPFSAIRPSSLYSSLQPLPHSLLLSSLNFSTC